MYNRNVVNPVYTGYNQYNQQYSPTGTTPTNAQQPLVIPPQTFVDQSQIPTVPEVPGPSYSAYHNVHLHYASNAPTIPMGTGPVVFRRALAPPPPPPEGFEVRHTKIGQPYLAKIGAEDTEGYMKERLSIFCKWKTIEEKYGFSVHLYFTFCKLLIVFYLVLTLIQTPVVISYLATGSVQLFIGDYGLKDLQQGVLPPFLFSSNFRPEIVWVWRSFNIVGILITFTFGPIYYFITIRMFRKRGYYDYEENLSAKSDNAIKGNEKVGACSRFFRRLISTMIFLLLLFIQLLVTLALTLAMNFSTLFTVVGSVGSILQANQWVMTPFSIGISLIISVMNIIFQAMSEGLTKLEKHKTWSDHRKHHAFKSITFRFVNVFIATIVKGFFSVPCILTVIGNQFLIQMLLDFLLTNVFSILVPTIQYLILKRVKPEKAESTRPDFDVVEHHLNEVYKLYIAYCGMCAFPYITVIGFVLSIVDLFMAKILLLKLCKKPPMTIGSVKSIVSFFLFIAAVLSILNFGGGNLYSIIGYYWCNPPRGGADECLTVQCGIFKGVPTAGFIPSLAPLMFPFLYGGGNGTNTTEMNSTMRSLPFALSEVFLNR